MKWRRAGGTRRDRLFCDRARETGRRRLELVMRVYTRACALWLEGSDFFRPLLHKTHLLGGRRRTPATRPRRHAPFGPGSGGRASRRRTRVPGRRRHGQLRGHHPAQRGAPQKVSTSTREQPHLAPSPPVAPAPARPSRSLARVPRSSRALDARRARRLTGRGGRPPRGARAFEPTRPPASRRSRRCCHDAPRLQLLTRAVSPPPSRAAPPPAGTSTTSPTSRWPPCPPAAV
jgi:hypothetical protein